MSDVTKQDLFELKNELKDDLRNALNFAVEVIITEMGIRFGEVNKRLDRMDATLILRAKQLAAGTKAIAGFSQWSVKRTPTISTSFRSLRNSKS